MEKIKNKIPLDILVKSKLFPIIDYNKKYGVDCGTENLTKGEIEKFNFVEGQKYDAPIPIPAMHYYNENTGKCISFPKSEIPRRKVGDEVTRLVWDENGICYDTIWIHLGRDYFKQISKTYDPRNC